MELIAQRRVKIRIPLRKVKGTLIDPPPVQKTSKTAFALAKKVVWPGMRLVFDKCYLRTLFLKPSSPTIQVPHAVKRAD
jgi:hypothetical protein